MSIARFLHIREGKASARRGRTTFGCVNYGRISARVRIAVNFVIIFTRRGGGSALASRIRADISISSWKPRRPGHCPGRDQEMTRRPWTSGFQTSVVGSSDRPDADQSRFFARANSVNRKFRFEALSPGTTGVSVGDLSPNYRDLARCSAVSRWTATCMEVDWIRQCMHSPGRDEGWWRRLRATLSRPLQTNGTSNAYPVNASSRRKHATARDILDGADARRLCDDADQPGGPT